MNFFTDTEKKIYNKDLFDEKHHFSIIEKMSSRDFAVSSTQLRNFYNQVVNHKLSIEQKIRAKLSEQKAFEIELPLIISLLPKVYYSCARKNKKVSPTDNPLYAFIKENIQLIKDYQDFLAFCLHFECLVAYSTGKLQK